MMMMMMMMTMMRVGQHLTNHVMSVQRRITAASVTTCQHNSQSHEIIQHTRVTMTSTGTLHTSAKASLTSVAIPIRIRIRDPDRHQNLIIYSLAHCQHSLQISRKSVWKFLRKFPNGYTDNRQQTTTIT